MASQSSYSTFLYKGTRSHESSLYGLVLRHQPDSPIHPEGLIIQSLPHHTGYKKYLDRYNYYSSYFWFFQSPIYFQPDG
jgi:hypothetical protein